MISKIIHCCWLSGDVKPKLAEKCLQSWKTFAPNYEVREWTLVRLEQLGCELAIPAFVQAALAQRKWAFAADWARFAALYLEGGIYFDYDFELLKPIDPLIAQGEFVAGQWLPNGSIGMEPAIIALERKSPIAKTMLEYYAQASFDGNMTVGEILAGQLSANRQSLTTLAPEVLSPIDANGVYHLSEATFGLHHYAMSWASPQRKLAKWLSWHGMRKVVELMLSLRGKIG